jgi:hypothetical protein
VTARNVAIIYDAPLSFEVKVTPADVQYLNQQIAAMNFGLAETVAEMGA